MNPNHLPHMHRIKTLSLPLAFVGFSAAVLPLSAAIQLGIKSRAEYRQDRHGSHYKGGSFDVDLTDGNVDSIFFCNDPNYFPPGTYIGPCSPGTAGFISAGSVNGADIQRPYLVIKSITPAFVVEPFQSDYVTLNSAPASKFPRPFAGFKDDSVSLFYNLNTTDIEEIKITRYFMSRNYTKKEKTRFKEEIVPGVYQFVFPGLVPVGEQFVFKPAAVSATIYPLPEGFGSNNGVESGVKFTNINNNKWNKNGYLELSYLKPNTFQWTGLDPTTVFGAVDTLYFALKVPVNPENPDNTGIVAKEAVFPAFNNGSDTRVKLRTPYINKFTIPPIFPSGTPAIAELQLQRTLPVGVTYDRSVRKFQIPVQVVNRYTDYQDISLGKSNRKSILADADNDGYNNLTEWILGSSGSDASSIPAAPTPADYQAVNIVGGPTPIGSYFGFNVDVQNETVPKVTYALQYSKDQGKTWEKFKNGYYLLDGSYSTTIPTDFFGFPLVDYRWSVQKVTTTVRGITTTEIQVRSGTPNLNPTATIPFVQPEGTISHIYRVKLSLKKKK